MREKRKRLKRGLVLALTLALVGNGLSQTMLTAFANEPSVGTADTKALTADPETTPDGTGPEGSDETKPKGDSEGTKPEGSDETKPEGDPDGTKPEGAGEEQNQAGSDPENTKNPSEEDSEKTETEFVSEVLDLGDIQTSAPSFRFFRMMADGKVALRNGTYEKWIDRIDVPDYARTLYNTLAEGADNDGVDDFLIDDRYFSAANALKLGEKSYNVLPVTTVVGDAFITQAEFNEIGKYIRAIYDAFDRDHPEVFWLTGTNQAIYTGSSSYEDGKLVYKSEVYFILKDNSSNGTFDVRKDNYQTASSIKQDITVRDQRVQAILNGAQSADPVDKLTYFNEWLTKNNEYNTSVASGGDAYAAAWECMSALTGKAGVEGPVCEGYARAFKVLCDRTGIPCVLVDGDAKSDPNGAGGAHMWNNVKVDGGWYGFDVTWNDPTGRAGAESGLENTDWSLVSSKKVIEGMAFEESHPVSNTASPNGTSFTNGPILSEDEYKKKEVPSIEFAAEPMTAVYTGKAVQIAAPTVSLADGTPVTDAQIAYSYKAAGDTAYKEGLPTDAGTYKIKASVASTAQYAAADKEANLTITKKDLTIKAQDQNITYGGSIKSGTDVIGNEGLAEGETIGSISLKTDGKNVGTYPIVPSAAVIKRGAADVTGNYNITYANGTVTIAPSDYTVEVTDTQSILEGSGSFKEPAFTGVNKETVDGALTYTYNGVSGMDYDALAAELAKLKLNAAGSISYTFEPKNGGNYTGTKTGTIKFTIKDIEFIVDGQPATAANAVTIKDKPVYGDNWSDIVTIGAVTAQAGDKSDNNKAHFTLSVSGRPAAGEQTFQVLYNGKIGNKDYVDSVVCEGKVTVGQRTLNVTAGSYKVSKVYDGTTDAGKETGTLAVSGRLPEDAQVTVTAALAAYADPNVGVQEIETELSLDGAKKENYVLGNTKVTVPYEITKKTIAPTVSVAEDNIPYTGEKIAPAVIVMDGSNELPAEAYDVTYRNNIDAGTATVTVSPKEDGNYDWSPAETVFHIVKVDFNGKKEDVKATRYGNTDSYDLKALLPAGYELGAITYTDENGIFDTAKLPAVENAVLSYKLVADSAKVGQTATITVPVINATNYHPFDLTITVTVTEKLTQDDFKFDVSDVKKAYGDSDFAVTAKNAAPGSAVTYTSNDPSVATVDANGNVHICRRGTAVITAKAEETDDYVSAAVSYTLTVSPKALAWDISGLQAVDRQGKIKENNEASLYGELRVTGILNTDKEKVTFKCTAAQLTGTYAKTTVGSQKVTLAWAGDPIELTGEDVENYTLPASLPELTGRINAVSEETNVPESTDTVKYKFEIEKGISQVPPALAARPELNLDTPAKIEEKMKAVIRSKLTGESNQNSVEVYDVVLMVQKEDGTWEEATLDNFPAGGVTVTLPYPEGTGKKTHNFEAAHMCTVAIGEYRPGDIEYPTVTKNDTNIQFKVKSLSPVSIGWKEIKTAGSTNTTDKGGSTVSGRTPSPKTGDTNTILLYVLFMMLGAAGIGYTARRKTMR